MADCILRLTDYAGAYGITLHYHEGVEVPENKGEALFMLCGIVHRVPMNMASWAIGECISFAESYCIKHGYDVWAALEEKFAYNLTRQDHTHEARIQPGGKSF